MPCLDDLDAPCLGQPDLYAVAASEGHLARYRDQYEGPCAVPKESVRDKLERFIENDFHHLALEVANLRGQLKVLLMLVGVIAMVTVGELVAMLVQEVVR